jgi:hypothetical protein
MAKKRHRLRIAKIQQERKKSGRPVGSKTKPRLPLLDQPAPCPKCDSTNRGPRRLVKIRKVSGTTADGRKFNQIAEYRLACLDCGADLLLRAVQYQPPAAIEENDAAAA